MPQVIGRFVFQDQDLNPYPVNELIAKLVRHIRLDHDNDPLLRHLGALPALTSYGRILIALDLARYAFGDESGCWVSKTCSPPAASQIVASFTSGDDRVIATQDEVLFVSGGHPDDLEDLVDSVITVFQHSGGEFSLHRPDVRDSPRVYQPTKVLATS